MLCNFVIIKEDLYDITAVVSLRFSLVIIATICFSNWNKLENISLVCDYVKIFRTFQQRVGVLSMLLYNRLVIGVVPAPYGTIYLVDINETHYWGSFCSTCIGVKNTF